MSVSDKHFGFGKNLLSCAEYINEASQYDGWVCVTLFYASLHFCTAVAFHSPQERKVDGGIVEFLDLDELWAFEKEKRASTLSKHGLLAFLIRDGHRSIHAKYQWLVDLAHTVRYTNLIVDETAVTMSIKYAKEIEAYATSIVRK